MYNNLATTYILQCYYKMPMLAQYYINIGCYLDKNKREKN